MKINKDASQPRIVAFFIQASKKNNNTKTIHNMENNKTNNTLLVIAAIIMTLMMGVMFFQNQTLDKYKALLKEEADTVISTDTIYLDREIKDTVPTVKWQHIVHTDTLWMKDSVTGEIVAQPMIVSLKKKATKINL